MAIRMVYALGEQLQKILGGLLSNDHECFEQICFYFSLSVCLHTVTIQAKNDRLRGPPHHRPVCAMVHIHPSQMCHHASLLHAILLTFDLHSINDTQHKLPNSSIVSDYVVFR